MFILRIFRLFLIYKAMKTIKIAYNNNEDLTKLKLDLESILKQSKLEREQEIAKQLEETKQSKLENLDNSFNVLQNKLDTYLKQ